MGFYLIDPPDLLPWTWNWLDGIVSGAGLALVMLVFVDFVLRRRVLTVAGASLALCGTGVTNALVRLLGGYASGNPSGVREVLFWGVYGVAGFLTVVVLLGLPTLGIVLILASGEGSGKGPQSGGPGSSQPGNSS
ncbi:MAG: hypothetical protein ACRD2M_08525 [Terriglobales bacterium]